MKSTEPKIPYRKPSDVALCRCGAELFMESMSRGTVWLCCERCRELVDTFDLPSSHAKPNEYEQL